MSIYWSEEDESFIANVPELPGCMAHGPTQEDALRRAQEAIQLWLGAAANSATLFPSPKVAA